MPTRRTYSGAFKARVALEMLKGQRTANEIGAAYGIHPVQAAQWKKQAVQALPEVLEDLALSSHPAIGIFPLLASRPRHSVGSPDLDSQRTSPHLGRVNLYPCLFRSEG